MLFSSPSSEEVVSCAHASHAADSKSFGIARRSTRPGLTQKHEVLSIAVAVQSSVFVAYSWSNSDLQYLLVQASLHCSTVVNRLLQAIVTSKFVPNLLSCMH